LEIKLQPWLFAKLAIGSVPHSRGDWSGVI